MDVHQVAVNAISATVGSLFARREPFRVFHGATNSTRPAHNDRVVDISALDNILEIDQVSGHAVVELNVSIDKLVQATLARGLVPPVVMEFPGITVGVGFAGSAGESSSFRYGYFSQTVEAIEMVLATGEVVCASATENTNLFHGAGGSAGTLGIVTKLKLRLIAARNFVKLTYHRYDSIEDTLAAVRRATENSANDYVDGIIFSKSHGLVMIGKLTDDMPASVHPKTFSGAWDNWFYLHARKRTTNSRSDGSQSVDSPTDYIPLAEYLFRYDRGGFWVGANAFAYFPFVPFNRLTRWFLNDFMHTRMLYRALQSSGNLSFGHMIQDLSLPYATVEAFINYSATSLNIWPLWLCPLKETERPTFHPSYCGPGGDGPPQPMINIGLWGAASNDMETFVRQNRELEKKLVQLGGRKVLYSHTYYTEDEFWGLYDKASYEALREKYGATTLPSVYDKVHVDVEKAKTNKKRGRTWMT